MNALVEHPATLLEALASQFPSSSRNQIRNWLKHGRVLVNGVEQSIANTPIQPGDVLELQNRKKFARNDLEIVYDDKDVVVVNKPVGLLSVPLDKGLSPNVYSLLNRYYKPSRVWIVHRLDRDTSGLLLFAKNPRAQEQLKKDFEAHAIQREYLAVVEGQLEEPAGVWRSYLAENVQCRVYTTGPQKGKEAITHFKTLATTPKFSLLHLQLETGRKNQIRVHCQEAGFPVAGDKKYGAATNPAKRVCLHAVFLKLTHPITGKPLVFRASAPKSFGDLFKCTPITFG